MWERGCAELQEGPMPHADEIRDAQRATWAGLSAGWEKWDSIIVDQLAPVGAAMIERLEMGEEQQHLDVPAPARLTSAVLTLAASTTQASAAIRRRRGISGSSVGSRRRARRSRLSQPFRHLIPDSRSRVVPQAGECGSMTVK